MNKDWYRIILTKLQRDESIRYYKCIFLNENRNVCARESLQNLNRVSRYLHLNQDEFRQLKHELEFAFHTMSRLAANSRDLNKKDKVLRNNLPHLDLYRLINTVEAREKADEIQEMSINSSPFMICSTHKNCATDHVLYQGKLYLRANWREFIQDKDKRELVKSYLSKYKIRTVEWVTGNPVYMISRPNCRHVFKPVPTDFVLSHTVKYTERKFRFDDARPKEIKLIPNIDKFKRNNARKMIKELDKIKKKRIR